jgi:hypothetical protein
MRRPLTVVFIVALLSALVVFFMLSTQRGEIARVARENTTHAARHLEDARPVAAPGYREPTSVDEVPLEVAGRPAQASQTTPPAVEGVAFEVRVWQPDGAPALGANVVVGATGTQFDGGTNAAGVFACRVDSKNLPVCEVSVMPSEVSYAWSRTNCVDRNQDLLRGEKMILDVKLVIGAALQVTARGERGEGLPQHLVQANYLGPNTGISVWRQRLAMTDGRGCASLPGLEPGTWDVYVPQWRGHGVSEHTSMELWAGIHAEHEVFAQELSRDAYSSGRFSSLAGGPTDEFGRLLGVRLERSDGKASDLFIHADGSFFIQGGPPDLKVRPVDQLNQRFGGWIPIRPGLHHGVIEEPW